MVNTDRHSVMSASPPLVSFVLASWLYLGMGLCIGCDRADTARQNGQTPAKNDSDRDDAQASSKPAQSSSDEDNDKKTESHSKENKKVKTLKVMKRTQGIEILVGKIIFEDGKPAQLKPVAEGPDAEKLKADWKEIVAEGEIPLEMREVKEVDGHTIAELNAVLVGPDDDRYYGAVWSYLEKKYKYLVDIEQ